jgi:hypothetical protein
MALLSISFTSAENRIPRLGINSATYIIEVLRIDLVDLPDPGDPPGMILTPFKNL